MPLYFLVGVLCIGSGLWIEDYLFYKLAFPALERPEEQGGFRVLAVRAVVLDMVSARSAKVVRAWTGSKSTGGQYVPDAGMGGS